MRRTRLSGAPERVQHHRVIGHNEQAVADHLAALAVPEEDYFIWLTGEGVKRLSRQFETDAIDPQLVRASAYWHAK